MNKKFKDSWESTLPEEDFTFKSAVMLKVKHISHNIHGSSAVSAIAKNLTYLNAPESSGHRTHCSELAACDQSSVPDRRSLWPSLCLHALHLSFFCGAVVFSCCSFIQLLFFFLHFPCVCVCVCVYVHWHLCCYVCASLVGMFDVCVSAAMTSTCWSSTTASLWTKALLSASPAAPPRSSSPWRQRRRESWRGSLMTWSRRTGQWILLLCLTLQSTQLGFESESGHMTHLTDFRFDHKGWRENPDLVRGQNNK